MYEVSEMCCLKEKLVTKNAYKRIGKMLINRIFDIFFYLYLSLTSRPVYSPEYLYFIRKLLYYCKGKQISS